MLAQSYRLTVPYAPCMFQVAGFISRSWPSAALSGLSYCVLVLTTRCSVFSSMSSSRARGWVVPVRDSSPGGDYISCGVPGGVARHHT